MMRRTISILGVMALAALTAGTAAAQFEIGMNYFYFENAGTTMVRALSRAVGRPPPKEPFGSRPAAQRRC